MTTTTKSWSSADVPGQSVRMTSVVKGPTASKTEMPVVKLKMP